MLSKADIQRKLLVGFVLSSVTVLFFVFMMVPNGEIQGPKGVEHFTGWAFIYAMYVFPFVCVYGVAVSLIAEVLTARLRRDGALSFVLSGLFHTGMGVAAGFLFQMQWIGIIGMIIAFLFFLMDWLFRLGEIERRRKLRIGLAAAPILVFGLTALALAVFSPPEPPFTEQDAVQFATSGKGTIIDLFPKQAGSEKLAVEGYQVERETRVTRLGKDTYEVSFIETWTKDGRKGTDRLTYKVTRGSMTASGSSGEEPPYPRRIPSG